jgi:RNA-binding protein YhbY
MENMVENEMSAKERLQNLQTALSERGVVDVKFFFNKQRDASLTAVATDVADVVEALLDGRYHPHAGVGDSVRTLI